MKSVTTGKQLKKAVVLNKKGGMEGHKLTLLRYDYFTCRRVCRVEFWSVVSGILLN